MWEPHKVGQNSQIFEWVPNVCAEQPTPGSAFCEVHSKAVKDLGFPTQLRDFILKCGADPSQYGKEGRTKVKQVLQEMSRHQATGLTETETGVDMQGITHLLADTGLVTRDNVEMSEVSTKCHKDIGDVHRLHKWSRGIQVIVGAGGIILDWAPLYRAENPLQVVFILFKYLLKRFCGVPESEFKDFFISYAPVLVLNQSHFFCNFSFWSSLQSKDFYLN